MKRPVQTLRMKGVDKISDPEHIKMIQNYETRRTLKAIREKQQYINILKCRLGNQTETVNFDLVTKLGLKLDKKLQFLRKAIKFKCF